MQVKGFKTRFPIHEFCNQVVIFVDSRNYFKKLAGIIPIVLLTERSEKYTQS